jgi:hypothetical protein
VWLCAHQNSHDYEGRRCISFQEKLHLTQCVRWAVITGLAYT